MADTSTAAGLTVEIAAWVAWFVVLLATLVASPLSLTVARVAAPAVIGIGLLIGALTGRWDGSSVLAIGFGAAFTIIVFLPTFGDHMINGSAYGSERRMALRPPAFALIGPIQVAWLMAFAGLVAAPLLILAERYALAGLGAAVGAAAAWFAGRILHQLARRWIVFVPAGFVIKDPVQLVDAVLLRRSHVEALGPATIDAADADDAADAEEDGGGPLDLTGGALGLALRVVVREPVPLTIRARGEHRAETASELLFTPTLPGAVLAEARIRGIKIGAPTSR